VTMQSMASSVPQGAILLIEDIDCAFPSRDADSADEDEDASPVPIYSPYGNGKRRLVTMSGLLNLMDGVGSDDHRIIFATVSSHFSSQHLANACVRRPTTTRGSTLRSSGPVVLI
jgi:hypothetical protein